MDARPRPAREGQTSSGEAIPRHGCLRSGDRLGRSPPSPSGRRGPSRYQVHRIVKRAWKPLERAHRSSPLLIGSCREPRLADRIELLEATAGDLGDPADGGSVATGHGEDAASGVDQDVQRGIGRPRRGTAAASRARPGRPAGSTPDASTALRTAVGSSDSMAAVTMAKLRCDRNRFVADSSSARHDRPDGAAADQKTTQTTLLLSPTSTTGSDVSGSISRNGGASTPMAAIVDLRADARPNRSQAVPPERRERHQHHQPAHRVDPTLGIRLARHIHRSPLGFAGGQRPMTCGRRTTIVSIALRASLGRSRAIPPDAWVNRIGASVPYR